MKFKSNQLEYQLNSIYGVHTCISHLGAAAFFEGHHYLEGDIRQWFFYPWPDWVKDGCSPIAHCYTLAPVFIGARLWGCKWLFVTFFISSFPAYGQEVISGKWGNFEPESLYMLRCNGMKHYFDESAGLFVGPPHLWPGPKRFSDVALITHNRMDEFHKRCPEADKTPVHIPKSIIDDMWDNNFRTKKEN